MSLSEEDIQASARIANLRPRSMANDTAHYFRNRTVLEAYGDLSGLGRIAACPPPGPGDRGRFVPLLDVAGCLDADLYIVPNDNGALIDVNVELAETVADRLTAIEGVVRRQNIWHNSRRKLAECGPRLGLGFRRRACGVASADARWSV
ncbi:MAG: hypothetical protein ACKVOP_11730, partial [Sphingomonadaceae bacterium]